jgi:hypothetical protein
MPTTETDEAEGLEIVPPEVAEFIAAQLLGQLASPVQWGRLDDVVYSLRGMLDGAGSMKRADVVVLSDAFGILRELLLRRPAEYGGPKECR